MDNSVKNLRLRHRGRFSQLPVYLGKQFRSFIYMSDWKILPMAAVIAALVGMVIRKRLFITMEGTLMGSFALTFVAIWNGCFNSIQVVCRERAIVKREHRSGMHISTYVFSHMLYQAILCVIQTAVTLYVFKISGVKFPSEGMMTNWFMLDIGITVFLITYASDMISLFVSSLAHTTTAAMTIMPFILIFQLVFSGSIISLPQWATHFAQFTISNYGLTCIASQADYNGTPMMQGWTTLSSVADKEISGDLPAQTILTELGKDDGLLSEVRAANADEIVQAVTGTPVSTGMTIGEIIDDVLATKNVQALKGESIHYSFKIRQLINVIGEDTVKESVIAQTTSAMYKEEYEHSQENVRACWMALMAFIVFFGCASVIGLEFIDKDKR